MERETDSLIDGLVMQLQPVRALRWRDGACLVGVICAATLLLVAMLYGMRPDVLAGAFSPMFVIANGLFLLLGLAAASSVVLMAGPQVGNRHDGWRWAVATTALLPLAALVTFALHWQEQPAVYTGSHEFNCLFRSAMLGLLTGGFLVLWLRRGAPVSPSLAGVLTGLAAGGIGSFAYGFVCPVETIYHLGVWHSLPVALSAIAGRVVVPALIRW